MPKVVDHEKRRAEILEQCFDLFAEHGYGAMTMRKIAGELGVSTGTLYHYFDGKPALFEAMFRWLRSRDIQKATEGLPADATQSDRLARLGEFLKNHQASLQQAVRVALDYQRQQSDLESRRFVAETVRDHPELASVLLSFLLGMSVHGILDPDAVVVDDHLLVLGLAAQTVPGAEGT